MSEILSTAYKTRDEAAMGGYESLKNSNAPLHTDEFAFYIVRIRIYVNNVLKIAYKYTPPVKIGASGGESSWRVSREQPVQAYCHTHPKRIQHEGFSPGDLDEYIKKAQIHPGMVWYLMTYNQQLRLAESQEELSKGGRPIKWLTWVKP